MPEFVISLDGDHGRLLVDGREPELFGDIVGCEIRDETPLLRAPLDAVPDRIEPRRTGPVVEVTLRLPVPARGHLTLLRDGEVRSAGGPTGDWVATAPSTATLARLIRRRLGGWFDAEEVRDVLLAVAEQCSDPATVRMIAEKLGIEVTDA